MPNGSPPVELPALCVVGRKNSGKTTLMVALVSELRMRGYRVATIKHGHHAFESDQPGRDSWRHFNEGGAEASIMCGTGKVALTERIDGEPDPRDLIGRLLSGRGYHVVLVEGWKHGTLPKLEVFRGSIHDDPLSLAPDAHDFVAVVTDVPARFADARFPAIPLDQDGAHVARVAELVEEWVIRGR